MIQNDEAEINRIMSMPAHELEAELAKEGLTMEGVAEEMRQVTERAIAEVARRRAADPRLFIALRLWHRFAPEGSMDWEEERHKAEYLDAVDGIETGDLFNLLLSRLNYDGSDTNSLTVGEIRRAVVGDKRRSGSVDSAPLAQSLTTTPLYDTLKDAEDHLIADGYELMPDSCDWIRYGEEKTIGAGCYYVDPQDAFNSKVRIEYEVLEQHSPARNQKSAPPILAPRHASPSGERLLSSDAAAGGADTTSTLSSNK